MTALKSYLRKRGVVKALSVTAATVGAVSVLGTASASAMSYGGNSYNDYHNNYNNYHRHYDNDDYYRHHNNYHHKHWYWNNYYHRWFYSYW